MKGFALALVSVSIAVLICAGPDKAFADAAEDKKTTGVKTKTIGVDSFDSLPLSEKVIYVDGAAMAAMLATGLSSWWNGGSDFGSFQYDQYDGWFGRDEPFAGVDKTAHAFGSYTASRALIGAYQYLGMEPEKAIRRGVFTGWLVVSMVELGDAFTEHGFSVNDILANTAGSLFAYLLETNPALDELLDFRIEYQPTSQLYDGEVGSPINDYMGMKFLVALKLAGIDSLSSGPFRYLEFHAGYYTRGYPTKFDTDGDRFLYAGISLSLTQIFRELGHSSKKENGYALKASTFFRYYQVSGISIDSDNR